MERNRQGVTRLLEGALEVGVVLELVTFLFGMLGVFMLLLGLVLGLGCELILVLSLGLRLALLSSMLWAVNWVGSAGLLRVGMSMGTNHQS